MVLSLSLKNITKKFGNLLALDNISLQIKPGEFVSIIGPSGCGKSTLFSIIAGVEDEISGEVYRDGQNLPDRKGSVGYMLQKPLLLPWRTVEDNVIFGLEIRGIPNVVARKKARKMLKEFGLSEFASSYPHTLSGGMAQKVALLRTILYNDELLLLDEPFGALDALTRLSLQFWLLDVWKNVNATVLFVTHDIREAILLSDRVLVMSKRPGSIIADITIDLPRPRKTSHLQASEAIALEKKLLKLLLGRSLSS